MATITFTKDSLREAITKVCDQKIAEAETNLRDATDPARLSERRAEWRAKCIAILRETLDQIEADDFSHGDMEDFYLPPRPGKAKGYTLSNLQDKVAIAKATKARRLSRVEAMGNDSIALTPKQLNDYFGV